MTKNKVYPIYLVGEEMKELPKLIKQGKKEKGLRVGRLILNALKQYLSQGEVNGETTRSADSSS